jgi:GDP-L-fucose synthase
MNPDPETRIYVAGHRGLAGSAIVRCLETAGCRNLIVRSHSELDLADCSAVHEFFQNEKPEYVFLAAAKAGGIVGNTTRPAEFIQQNIAIQTNVIHEAWKAGVQRLLFLGSSCIYPRDCLQPIREEYLLTGPLESTNRSYAIAKIAGVEMCSAYNRQYGTQFVASMPTNLYGPGDNYDLETSHVMPALIRKMHQAARRGDAEVVIWGTGTPRREFLYSDDMADACVFLMSLPDSEFEQIAADEPPLINVGSGSDLTVRELAELVAGVVGFSGRLRYDGNRPDGTPRKLLDSSRLTGLGWKSRVSLEQGVALACRDFLRTHPAES